MPNPFTNTVFIVEDDPSICNALEWLFKSVSLSSRAYHSGIEFLQNYHSDWNGCILLDLRMPEISGLEVQERLNALHNKLPIIFITGHGDISLAVRAMKAGAYDFITKPFNNQNLLEKIQHAISHHEKHTNTITAHFFLDGYAKLTPRELGILHCIIDGKLNKQIAADLKISTSTVEMHRANIMQKLGVKSIATLVKHYMLYEHLLINHHASREHLVV